VFLGVINTLDQAVLRGFEEKKVNALQLWLKNIPQRLTIEADMSRICVPFNEGEAVYCLTKT